MTQTQNKEIEDAFKEGQSNGKAIKQKEMLDEFMKMIDELDKETDKLIVKETKFEDEYTHGHIAGWNDCLCEIDDMIYEIKQKLEELK